MPEPHPCQSLLWPHGSRWTWAQLLQNIHGPCGSWQPATTPDKSSFVHTGPGRLSATLLQSLLHLCQPLQPCPWKSAPQLAYASMCASEADAGERNTSRGGEWHSWSRDLPRGLGEPPGEVGVGCSSPWVQGHWEWRHHRIFHFLIFYIFIFNFIF